MDGRQCKALTRKNQRCSRSAWKGSQYCRQHQWSRFGDAKWYCNTKTQGMIGITGLAMALVFFCIDQAFGPTRGRQEKNTDISKSILRHQEQSSCVSQEILNTAARIEQSLAEIEERLIANGSPPINTREDTVRLYSPAKQKEYEALVAEYQRIEKQLQAVQKQVTLGLNAQLVYAWTLHTLQRLSEAEVAYRSVMAAHPQNRAAMRGLGMVLFEVARYEEAEEIFLKVLQKYDGVADEGDRESSKDMNNLAMLYFATEELEQAEECIIEAVKRLEDEPLAETTTVAIMASNYGSFLAQQGKMADAERECLKAVTIGEEVGSEKPLTALFYHNLSAVYRRDGRLGLAFEYQTKAVNLWSRTLPDRHYWTAGGLHGLGEVWLAKGEIHEAKKHFEKSLVCIKEAFGEFHPWTAVLYQKLAHILKEEGNFDMARKQAESSLEITRKVFGNNRLPVAAALNQLGEVLRVTNRSAAAEGCFREAIRIHELRERPDLKKLGSLKGNLGLAVGDMGRLSEAEVLLREALVMDRQAAESGQKQTVVRLYNLAAFLQDKRHNIEEAVALYEEALAIAESTLPKSHPDIGRILNNLGAIQIKKPETRDEGRKLIQRAFLIFEASYGLNHPITRTAMHNLGML